MFVGMLRAFWTVASCITECSSRLGILIIAKVAPREVIFATFLATLLPWLVLVCSSLTFDWSSCSLALITRWTIDDFAILGTT